MRYQGQKKDGEEFDQSIINRVWRIGKEIPGKDPSEYRLDACGALIRYGDYGLTKENGTGWEIDHIFPVSKGGSDDLSNLQPLQWENNRYKSDNWPEWTCLKASNK